MADAPSFSKFVPGFDFLQGLVKNAGAALPSIGQWVAPTLNPEELEKRINELRTVQFWLEQNARMLGATIQALEVQRMTLSTLKTMNVQMGDLRDSLKIRLPGAPAEAPAEAEPASSERPPAAAEADADAGTGTAKAAPMVDPMQWWGALTNQFTQLATTALKDTGADAAKTLAGSMMQKSFDAAGETMKKMAASATPRRASSTSSASAAATPARKSTRAVAKPASKR